ncbi:CC2D1A [Cervus elaphus hippelaphus]|uniref:Coiled-coil and C2 domain-containing protein 1A n=1 Tax=Cervus elaphus hippelaphus TaxID=46360 RepID=A0A212D1C0_CEREH|nr:CC2D1A [Cervus elaphus hippelaphus]
MEAIEKMASLCMRDPDEDEEEGTEEEDVEADDDLLPKATTPSPGLEATLQERLALYQTAIESARQAGDSAKMRRYDRGLKSFDAVLEALSRGEPVDLSRLPPPPGEDPILPILQDCWRSPGHQLPQGPPSPPVQSPAPAVVPSMPEAPPPPKTLLEALEQRMERYHVAAAQAKTKGDQRKARMHERIVKLSSPAAPTAQPKAPPSKAPPSGSAPIAKAAPKGTSTRAQQQLAFLEGRKKQLLQAALRAKQKNDVEGAKMHLRQAKGLEPMLEASRNGLPVDITKVPPAPINKDDFALVQRPGPGLSQESARRYGELTKLIRQQHEMCLNHSNQFTQLGNIAETSKFEKLAEDCKRSMEILKQAFARGLPTPTARFEQRTFSVIKIFPDLSSNDMLLFIVKGISLPTPPGLSPGDLDVFVRFDFPYPNVEEAQKDKTSVIKNTDSPEFKEQFKLCINRNHRGFRRAIQTKGIKFEVVHKGGLFKTDRVLGTAQLKLDALETACEVREVLEVAGPKGKAPPIPAPTREAGNRSARPLHSLSVLAFDQERLERKILALRQARRPVPPEVAQQYQDIMQRSQWQRAQLEQGGPGMRRGRSSGTGVGGGVEATGPILMSPHLHPSEYMAQLERQLQFYTEAARRLGNDGSREAAKEALYRRNLVESELQRLRR